MNKRKMTSMWNIYYAINTVVLVLPVVYVYFI